MQSLFDTAQTSECGNVDVWCWFFFQMQFFRTKFSVIEPICSGILYTSGKRNHSDDDFCPIDLVFFGKW